MDYKGDLDVFLKEKGERSLATGLRVSLLITLIVSLMIPIDILVLHTQNFLFWRILSIIPGLGFIFFRLTKLRSNLGIMRFLHALTLFNLVLMAVGIVFTVYTGTNVTQEFKFNSVNTLIICFIGIFFFSNGVRELVWGIVVIPMVLLLFSLALYSAEFHSTWVDFVNPCIVGVMVIFVARVQENLIRQEFLSRQRAEINASEKDKQLEIINQLNHDLTVAYDQMSWEKAFTDDIMNSTHDHLVVIDRYGTILMCNQAWIEFAVNNGLTENSKCGVGANYLAPCRRNHNLEGLQAAKGIEQVLSGELPDFSMDYRCDSPTEHRYFSMIVIPLLGSPDRVLITHRNYTERKKNQDALERSESFLRAITEFIPGMVGYWTKDLHCRFANHAYYEWFGKTPEQMIGISIQDLLGEEIFKKNEAYIYGALKGQVQRFERAIPKPDGTTGYTFAHYAPDIFQGEVLGFFVLVSDITDLKVAQNQLEEANQTLTRLSLTDALTEIANRRQFDLSLEIEWKRSVRSQTSLSIAILDIDYFKHFNDTFGHQEGDKCLVKVAKALASSVRRPADLVTRYGGEEFAIILPDTNLEGAIVVLEKARESVKALDWPVTISAGIASVIPGPAIKPQDILKLADAKLYEAKNSGRDCCKY